MPRPDETRSQALHHIEPALTRNRLVERRDASAQIGVELANAAAVLMLATPQRRQLRVPSPSDLGSRSSHQFKGRSRGGKPLLGRQRRDEYGLQVPACHVIATLTAFVVALGARKVSDNGATRSIEPAAPFAATFSGREL
jgi:hypothetical protein